MVVEVYSAEDPYPIELPTEPEHERIVEAVGPEGGMTGCWEWDKDCPSPRFLGDSSRGAWKLRGSYGHPGEPPVPWGRAFWDWHEIVSVCVQRSWQLTAYPRGR